MGIIINRMMNLGEKFFPKMSGRVSVAIPEKKENSTESRKYVAHRFRGV